MPRGKGTYGSKVGRPPKKKKSKREWLKKHGDKKVGPGPDKSPTLRESMLSKKDDNYEGGGLVIEIGMPSSQEEFPINDARQRTEFYQEGGLVAPKKPKDL